MMPIGRISVFIPVMLFVGYIVIHYLLIKRSKKLEQESKNNTNILKGYHTAKLMAKWFPAVYVIVVLMIYFML
jgi:hypothetical protein